LIGALTGNNNVLPGLAIGAVGGTVVGAATAHDAQRRAYYEAYQDCMGNY